MGRLSHFRTGRIMGATRRKRPSAPTRGRQLLDADNVIERRLQQRRRVRRASFVTLTLLAVSVLLAHWGQGGDGDDWARFDRRRVTVISVSLNGTVTVQSSDGRGATPVRLLGIDLPRAGSLEAAASSRELASRALGLELILRLEPLQTRSTDGTLLAYLFPSDTEDLNLDMVRDGFAYADRRMQHSLRVQFEQAESDARKKARGIWKAPTEEQMPDWRRQWLNDLKDKKHVKKAR